VSKVSVHQRKARDFIQREDWGNALVELERMLEADRNNPTLQNQVGDVYLRKEDVARACEHFEQAIDLYAQVGLHNNAVALCKKVMRLRPGRIEMRYRLARLRLDQGFRGEAAAFFAITSSTFPMTTNMRRGLEANCREIVELMPEEAPLGKILEKLEGLQCYVAAHEIVRKLSQRAADSGDEAAARRYTEKLRSLRILVERKRPARSARRRSAPGGPPSSAAESNRNPCIRSILHPRRITPATDSTPAQPGIRTVAPQPAAAQSPEPAARIDLDGLLGCRTRAVRAAGRRPKGPRSGGGEPEFWTRCSRVPGCLCRGRIAVHRDAPTTAHVDLSADGTIDLAAGRHHRSLRQRRASILDARGIVACRERRIRSISDAGATNRCSTAYAFEPPGIARRRAARGRRPQRASGRNGFPRRSYWNDVAAAGCAERSRRTPLRTAPAGMAAAFADLAFDLGTPRDRRPAPPQAASAMATASCGRRPPRRGFAEPQRNPQRGRFSTRLGERMHRNGVKHAPNSDAGAPGGVRRRCHPDTDPRCRGAVRGPRRRRARCRALDGRAALGTRLDSQPAGVGNVLIVPQARFERRIAHGARIGGSTASASRDCARASTATVRHARPGRGVLRDVVCIMRRLAEFDGCGALPGSRGFQSYEMLAALLAC
jgi:tetratricopeptide (TPR) repeat protein